MKTYRTYQWNDPELLEALKIDQFDEKYMLQFKDAIYGGFWTNCPSFTHDRNEYRIIKRKQ